MGASDAPRNRGAQVFSQGPPGFWLALRSLKRSVSSSSLYMKTAMSLRFFRSVSSQFLEGSALAIVNGISESKQKGKEAGRLTTLGGNNKIVSAHTDFVA